MPILVKDYDWRETKDRVFVTVPLKGVKATNVDLLCTNEFVKASYPPFLFEAVLFERVNDDESVAKIRDGCVQFSLKKQTPQIWSRLTSEMSDDKAFMLERKKEAIEYVRAKTEEQQKEKAAKKSQEKKYTLKETMKLEEGERTRIQTIKDETRQRTEAEMEIWKKQRQEEEEREKLRMIKDKMEKSLGELDMGENEASQQKKPEKEIFNDKIPEEFRDENPNGADAEKPTKPRGSKPREGGKISFKFTPRVFPTPLRESKTAEEEEWLKKQMEARKITDVDDADLKEHEKDPIWLKDKGNSLFESGNYLAAINAYNLAIRMQPRMHSLYANRSACHLKLRNFFKCIEDCSTSLDLLQPPVPANAGARLKAHIRKGAALCELEMYPEGLMDYMAALEIDPKNEHLQVHVQKIREIIEKGDTEKE